MKNNDNKHFIWSIIAYLHPANDRHVDRLSKYKPYEKNSTLKKSLIFLFKILVNLKTRIILIFLFEIS